MKNSEAELLTRVKMSYFARQPVRSLQPSRELATGTVRGTAGASPPTRVPLCSPTELALSMCRSVNTRNQGSERGTDLPRGGEL